MVNHIPTAYTREKSSEANTVENTLDDVVFEQGNQHAIQITGGPTASMMSLEHREAIISVAPAEGQKAMTDPHFEAMFYPDKF